MRTLFVLLGVLLLSAVTALWFHEQAGYVLVSVGSLTIETSLFLAIGLAIVTVLAGFFLLRLLVRMLRAPGSVRGWWRRRRRGRSRERLLRGLVKLTEGDYAAAEKALVKSFPQTESPLLAYLGAAWVAHHSGAPQRRDDYLAMADKTGTRASLAVGLVQAQLYIEDAQWETAFATLNYLYDSWPKQPRVLDLLAKVCEPLGEWDRLLALLPMLRRHGGLTREELDRLERRAARGSLLLAARQSEAALSRAWQALPKSARATPDVILTYVDARLSFDPGDTTAEQLLRAGLKQEWRPHWVDRYGRLQMRDPGQPFAAVEAWLKERPQDASLLLAAGRLAIANALWGRARGYLDSAVAREPTGEACYLLAGLQERMGEAHDALASYRRAAELGAGFEPPDNIQRLGNAG